MTKQEIITKCIEAYTEAIEVCKSLELHRCKLYLDSHFLITGVCRYANKVLGEWIFEEEWVMNKFNIHGYWTTPAYKCTGHSELIQSLQTRLDILKRELEIPE